MADVSSSPFSSSTSAEDFVPVRGRGSGRGRGRPPGRGRGRGRGGRGGVATGGVTKQKVPGRRGRGRGMRLDEDDVARVRALQEDRTQQAADMVQSLTEGEAKEILNHLVIDNPAILLTVRDTISKRSAERLRTSEEGGGGDGGSNSDDLPPSWCYCTRCIEMPTDVEKLCCGMTPDYCLSIVPEIDLVITDPMVLHLQMLYRNDLFALHAQQDTDIQRSRRHAAYRQYVLWQHGRLGAGDRRIIPACCVKVIRDRYPDRNNIYTGYRPGRLN